MKLLATLSAFLAINILSVFNAQAEESRKPIIIKLAGVAPEGTVYMDISHQFEKSVEEKTGGTVDIRWYSGGVLGDEPDMVRLMKLGQLQGAGMTGVGMGKIDIRLRVLELPMLLKSYKEVDIALQKVFPYLQKIAEEKGFLIIAPSEAGFVYLFSKNQVSKIEDLKGVRLWLWERDPFAVEVFRHFKGAIPVLLPVTDVPMGFSTGLLDAFYASPLVVIALQVYGRVKYMTDFPITYGSGFFVVNKKWFEGLPSNIQKIFISEGKKYFKIMKEEIRGDNEKSLKALEEKGLVVVKPSPDFALQLKQIGKEIQKKMSKEYNMEKLIEAIKKLN